MSWESDCPGAGEAPVKVLELEDPAGEGRQAGRCPVCDHNFWMADPDLIPPHGPAPRPRPKGTEIRELDD